MEVFLEIVGGIIEWSGDVMFNSIKSTVISVVVVGTLIGIVLLIF